MSFPDTTRLEAPILQELSSMGGREQPRFLYDRLKPYFPQLTGADLALQTETGRSRWHLLIQRAAAQLVAHGEMRRERNLWEITPRGIRRVEAEALLITAAPAPQRQQVTHSQAQQMLVEIGQLLGRHAETEYERYDVVWRDTAAAPRLSHVFEVQISGSVDSALTRLKQAWDAQRSQIYLVIADERDTRFADKRLISAFHEILNVVTLIGVGELERLYESLRGEESLLQRLTSRKP